MTFEQTPAASNTKYAYDVAGQANLPGVITERVTPVNSQPLMLLWLFISTDPAYSAGASPEDGALGFDYTTVAETLNMSPDYVKYFFSWASQYKHTFSPVQALFTQFVMSSGYDPNSGNGSCVECDRILALAPNVARGWGQTTPVTKGH